MASKGEIPTYSFEKPLRFFDTGSSEIAGNQEFSTSYQERLNLTPKLSSKQGNWRGERAESDFVPADDVSQRELAKHGTDCVQYKDAVPNFTPVSEATVSINEMTDDRYRNYSQADAKCAEQWNAEGRDGKTDWTDRDVADWRTANGYTWHECCDMKTCNLVKTELHESCRHSGGVAEYKASHSMEGGQFDE